MPHVFLSKQTSPSKFLERFLEVSTTKTTSTHFAALWISGTWRDSYCPEWSNTSDRVSDASLTQGCSKRLERATPAECWIWCLSPPEKTSLYIPPNGKRPENQRELKRASYHLLRSNCRSSQRWQPMVVGSEDHQKSTGRLSNRKILGKSWELPTSKRVTSDTFLFPVVLWLVESRRSLHPLPTSHLARCVNLIFMLQSSGPKSLCVFFFVRCLQPPPQ